MTHLTASDIARCADQINGDSLCITSEFHCIFVGFTPKIERAARGLATLRGSNQIHLYEEAQNG